MDEALHGEPEDRLLAADGVTAGHRAAGLAHDLGAADDRMAAIASLRQALGEGGDVERHHHPAAHGEHVAAGVGGGDGTEVGRVVDERREEVGRRHDGEVVADPVDGGVVERRQADEQRRVGAGRPGRGRAGSAARRPTSPRSHRRAVHSVSLRSGRRRRSCAEPTVDTRTCT